MLDPWRAAMFARDLCHGKRSGFGVDSHTDGLRLRS